MALTLALRYPALFAAVGTHSGAVPHSVSSALQARASGLRSVAFFGATVRRAVRRVDMLAVVHRCGAHHAEDFPYTANQSQSVG